MNRLPKFNRTCDLAEKRGLRVELTCYGRRLHALQVREPVRRQVLATELVHEDLEHAAELVMMRLGFA